MTSEPENQERQARQAIEQVLERLERAIGDKDIDEVTVLFGPDSVMMTLAAPLRRASQDPLEGRAALASWFASWDGPVLITHQDLVVEASGDVAFAHMLCHMVGTRKDTGPVDLWYRETYGLRRIDGAWKIAHEHQSVPMAMDGSGKAELTLTP